MANTHKLISSSTLSSAASSVTFSSIPATYTDLKLVISSRATNNTVSYVNLRLQFNNTSAVYSTTGIYSYSTTVAAAQVTGASYASEQGRGSVVGGANTANTFGATEIYIPNYTNSYNKPLLGFGVNESNDTTNDAILSMGHLYRDTNAISTITASISSTTFVAESSFYLYGITNS